MADPGFYGGPKFIFQILVQSNLFCVTLAEQKGAGRLGEGGGVGVKIFRHSVTLTVIFHPWYMGRVKSVIHK